MGDGDGLDGDGLEGARDGMARDGDRKDILTPCWMVDSPGRPRASPTQHRNTGRHRHAAARTWPTPKGMEIGEESPFELRRSTFVLYSDRREGHAPAGNETKHWFQSHAPVSPWENNDTSHELWRPS